MQLIRRCNHLLRLHLSQPPRPVTIAAPIHWGTRMSLPPLLRNLRIPAIGSPLFIVSNPDLVIAQCTSRSEEHTSELQSLMRISYAVFCFKQKKHPLNQKKQIDMKTN